MAKLRTENCVATQVVDTVACTVKVKVPDSFSHKLDELYGPSLSAARRMIKNRNLSSSKHYKEIPCVVSKSLIAKYQKNPKCKNIRNLVIPICGDKGRQIKLTKEGVRIPSLWKKNVLPVFWPRPVVGFVRSVEMVKRDGSWYAIFCFNTPTGAIKPMSGVVGVDRNSVGNIAVMANPATGKVFKLGLSPAPTKANMRGRRKNLQKAGKFRLLSKLRRKQRRRMTHENHRASRTVVDYAAKHHLAVALEDLKGIRSESSKARRYSEQNQWAFAQLETFICYKAILRGITVIRVNPAFTSQDCSRCGSRHKTSGKVFRCQTCGHKDHRDANAAFNIGIRGLRRIGDLGPGLSVSGSGLIDEA